MKTTIDIPGDLYRQVKAKSALQSQTVREVTVALYRSWLDAPPEGTLEKPATSSGVVPRWFGAARKYAERVERHDMDSMRESIATGRKAERLTS